MGRFALEDGSGLSFAARVFSIGVFWMLLFVVLLENGLFAFASASKGAFPLFHISAFLAGALVSGAAPIACRKGSRLGGKGVAGKAACGLVLVAACVDAACSLAHLASPWLQWAIWVLLGMALACYFLAWVRVPAALTRRGRIVLLASSASVGALLYYTVNAMGAFSGLVVLVPCVLAGAWIARAVDAEAAAGEGDREKGPGPAGPDDPFRMPVPFYVAVAIYSSVFGLVFAQIVRIHEPFWVELTALALALPAVALWIAAVYVPAVQRWIENGVLQRSIAALVVAGVLPLALFGESVAAPCCLVIAGSFSLYSIADMASRFIVAPDCRPTPLAFAAKRQAFLFVGLAAGFAVGVVLPLVGEGSSIRSVAFVALAFTVLLIVIVAATPYPSAEVRAEPAGAQGGSGQPRRWGAACEAVAARHGLTKRESEVFGLLAKGRSTRYIQEELVISPHTVETHIHNIYTKMDIGSRDDLIRLVEKEVAGADDRGRA